MAIVPTVFRHNPDSVIFFRPENEDQWREIYKTAGYGNKKKWIEFMDGLFSPQEPYTFIYRDTQGPNTGFYKNFTQLIHKR